MSNICMFISLESAFHITIFVFFNNRPRALKLADFEACVVEKHKDSNMQFCEEFKVNLLMSSQILLFIILIHICANEDIYMRLSFAHDKSKNKY